jgi:hypothetical protein
VLAAASTLLLLPPPAFGAQSSADTTSSYNASLNGLAAALPAALNGYMIRTSPADPRYYADGVWYATDGVLCWYCYDSAAVGAATLSQVDDDPSLAQVAIATFNTALSQHQLPSGAIDFADGAPDGIGTGFFAVNLGITYLELETSLDSATQARWRTAIAAAASYLISSGNTTWYINGNINLRQTEVMWLAWAITHQQRFLAAYNAEWTFTVAPAQSRWSGYGLKITHTPTRSDGSNGAGYLAESGGGKPGFDPAYTQAQLDTATDLYVLTRDPRYLRLMNLEFNQLRPLINTDWTLDAEGGTRENYLTPFMSAAVSVLAASGDRPDLVPMVSSQLTHVESSYKGAATFTNVNFYKGFECWLSMPLLNRQWPQGMALATPQAVTVNVSPLSTNTRLLTQHPLAVTIANAPLGSIVRIDVARGSTPLPRASATRRNVQSRNLMVLLRLSPRSVRLHQARGNLRVNVTVQSIHDIQRRSVVL